MEVTLEQLEQKGYSHQNSCKTQRQITSKTYDKVAGLFQDWNVTGDILDYGAGMGHGGDILNADTFEPYPVNWEPTFTNVYDIHHQYDGIVCLNVLCVLPQPLRDEAITLIGGLLKPSGVAVIGTRGTEVMKTKTGIKLSDSEVFNPEPYGTYQNGHTQKQLKEYIISVLGDGYEVESIPSVCTSAVRIKKDEVRQGIQ